MTKAEMFAIGFVEENGWMVHPRLKVDGESGEVFKIGTIKFPNQPYFGFEERNLAEVLEVLAAASFSAGSRWGKKHERDRLITMLQKA